MPNITPIQADFSVGEITPDVNYRSTLEARNRGVRTLTNFVTDSRGPISRRAGFRFLGKVGESLPVKNACDNVPRLFKEVGPSSVTNNRGNGGFSADRDFGYIAVGANTNEGVDIWQNQGGGTWVIFDTLVNPPGDIGGFGTDVSHSQQAGLMVVGAPNTDHTGTDAGSAFVYFGSNATGWTFSEELRPLSPVTRQNFGGSVEISEDGSVIAVGAPSNDVVGSPDLQSVYIYDRVGETATFIYRNQLDESNDDAGFGWGVALSNDASILIIGDATHGVGAAGEVTVWDDVGGIFTKRQTIPAINLADEGIPGFDYAADQRWFGAAVRLSEDNQSLFIWYSGYTTDGATRNGMVCTYRLNTDTNEYEFCDWFAGNGFANLRGMDVSFTGDSGSVAISQQSGSSRGRVDIYA